MSELEEWAAQNGEEIVARCATYLYLKSGKRVSLREGRVLVEVEKNGLWAKLRVIRG